MIGQAPALAPTVKIPKTESTLSIANALRNCTVCLALVDAIDPFQCRHWYGGKIHFSPPPPLSLAGGSWRVVYGDSGVTETDCVIGSNYFGDSKVDRHHLIIQQNAHSIFPALGLTGCFRDFIDPCNLCGSSWLGTLSYSLTLFLCSSCQNCSFS